MTAGSSKSEDKDIIIVAIDEQPIWGDGCRGAKALALFAWEDGARGGEGVGEMGLGAGKALALFPLGSGVF